MRTLATIAVTAYFIGAIATLSSFAGSDVEIVAMVEKAAAMFKEKGKDYSLKVIGSQDGPFRRKELYVFAISIPEGIQLAHPVNKELEGKNVLDLKDKNGKLYVREFIKTATDHARSGWVEHYWQRHGEKEPTLKRTYVLKVPGENILVAGGLYEK